MRSVRSVTAAILAALLLAGVARADEAHVMPETYVVYPALNSVATFWAQRPAVVGCGEDQDEWDFDLASSGTWGYTWLDADWTGIAPGLCEFALLAGKEDFAGADPWRIAIAIHVVTHESWHLRWWRWRADEARVECKAIKSFKKSAKLLGAEGAAVDELYSWAWAFHVREGILFPDYALKGCRAPKPSITWTIHFASSYSPDGWTWDTR